MRPLHGLYEVASIRRIEAAWLAQSAPGTLMARAARAVAEEAIRLLRAMPPQTTVLLLVGPGNNGGDALEAGRLLSRSGFAVRALAVASVVSDPPRAPDAAAAWRAWRQDGGTLNPLEDPTGWPPGPTLVIDGLFGIGLTRALPSSLVPLLDWIDRSRAPVLAIDVPSGIDADTGAAVEGGSVMRAVVTVTMIADKPGLHTGTGLVSSGKVVVATLADPGDAPGQASEDPAVRGVRADAVLVDAGAAMRLLPPRGIDAHKGTSGDVLVVGGRLGMTGAGRLAARGALGAGAGKVWIAGGSVAADAATEVADPFRPEIMRDPMAATGALPPRVKVVVIGCGLGQDRAARRYLQSALASDALMVCDADALNLVATHPRLARRLRARAAPTILTPHPLEAARLLAWPTAQVQSDRIAAAVALARRFGAVAVLKGAGTVIAAPSGHYAINGSGNPVLATGGTGDVLAGIIGAVAAAELAAAARSGAGPRGSHGAAPGIPRGAGSGSAPGKASEDALAAATAACAGVWLHGAAGDLAARQFGPAGVPAGMIADLLPAVLRLEPG